LLADHCQKVYSIEPDIINLKALERNILLNKTKNIQTFNLALSDNSEPLYLNSSSKSNWHSTTKQADRDSKKISALSVDEFCERENIQPTILKMDIEGFEKYVIPGAKKTLSKLKALFFELHSTHLTLEETNSILDVIEQSGLCLYKVIRYDRPGLWKEESLNIVDLVRKGDYGIYEMIYTTPSQRGPS